MKMIDCSAARAALPARNELSDKRGFGQLLCVCGCDAMPGAAVLSCTAAARSGVGLVRLFSTDAVCRAASFRLPECVPSPQKGENGVLSPESLPALSALLPHASAVLFGCGVSVSREGEEVLSFLLQSCPSVLIIDADGLNILSKRPELIFSAACPVILTPHTRELARLCRAYGDLPPEALAEKLSCTLVCKGAETRVFGREGFVLPARNSALAKGGSGDVLAGIISSLAAQGASPEDAALCGVYLHSRAGFYAREAQTAYCALPSDVIAHLPQAFSELL